MASEFYHVVAIRSRERAPHMHPMHAEFYNGTALDFDPRRPTEASARPLRIAKNAHAVPGACYIDGGLIVPESCAERIASRYGTQTMPVIIEKPYRFPWQLGSDDFLLHKCGSPRNRWYPQVAMCIAKETAIESWPHEEFRELAVVESDRSVGDMHVTYGFDPDRGINAVNARFWAKDVEDRGIVRCLGFIVSQNAMEILKNQFNNLFWNITPVVAS